MLRRRTVTAGCALAISTLTILATPALADRDPLAAGSAPSQPAPTMVDAMSRDLGITKEQAESRLLNEARLTGTEAKVRESLGGGFAGSWLSGPTSATLTVATTDAAAASKVSGTGVQAVVVERSLAQLNAVKDALDNAAAKAPKSTPVWFVDARTNSVVVQSSQPAEAEAFIAASGADKAAVRVERSGEAPRTYYDLRGGDAYYIGSGSRCSIGFSVRRGTTPGFVSAGHCGRAGQTTSGYNRVAQGSFQGSSFPGNDYSWVSVNSNWTPAGVVKGSGGANVAVRGSTVAVEGASICRSGSTTGWRCGTVQQRNTSVTYSQGTVREVTRTNVCAEPGDSGGSFISGSQAQGVTSGGSGNCSSGGTTFFQPVNEILSVYGLTLVTS
ncbi:serine protease [Sphaerisporangium siamense]|uniref:Streptogrisin C n=1 Tax=Sphaerisporangium siamense TaxID=795645 RepID=A0A7W7DI72_9ACTN|nr:S1 family peptidase [Sphaerisporangium siamense]MBB4705798.1 streptogrisin C [Sphaerisporangium siamense]GII82814.1 serine protease [Sphaerisporangium siamense]